MMTPTETKRILLFSTKFPPPNGGEAMAGYDFASLFSKMGYAVSVVTPSDCRITHPTAKLFTLPLATRTEASNPEIDYLLSTFFEKTKPDLVFINGTLFNTFDYYSKTILSLTKKHSLPVVYRPHAPIATNAISFLHPPFFGVCRTFQSIVAATKRLLQYASAQSIVFLSNQKGVLRNQDRLLAEMLHCRNIATIPNTFQSIKLETNTFRQRYQLTNTLFVCIGSFSTLKNQMGIVKAVKKSHIFLITIVFIAPSRNLYAIQTETEAGNDRRFVFLYNLSRKEVIEAHNACDCEIIYSRQEQQPLVLLEAMCCGKPWIAPDVGSVGELTGGIILKNRNYSTLLFAINRMLDAATRDRFGREGKLKWESTFTPEVVSSKWKAILTDAMKFKF